MTTLGAIGHGVVRSTQATSAGVRKPNGTETAPADVFVRSDLEKVSSAQLSDFDSKVAQRTVLDGGNRSDVSAGLGLALGGTTGMMAGLLVGAMFGRSRTPYEVAIHARDAHGKSRYNGDNAAQLLDSARSVQWRNRVAQIGLFCGAALLGGAAVGAVALLGVHLIPVITAAALGVVGLGASSEGNHRGAVATEARFVGDKVSEYAGHLLRGEDGSFANQRGNIAVVSPW